MSYESNLSDKEWDLIKKILNQPANGEMPISTPKNP
jgi:hypothetical protein